jgi:hypothetical protein
VTIEPTHCQTPDRSTKRICLRGKGHQGAHVFTPIAELMMRLPDGSVVRFGGWTV